MTGKKGKKTKDLAPKGNGKIKGGRLGANENLTLVRAAESKKNSR